MAVDILLATYNGGKYLRAQLDSILNQTNQDWRLIVRDDGSKDDTLKVLEEYQRDKFPEGKMVILRKDPNQPAPKPKNKNSSVIRNFSALMEKSKSDGKADYIMFCDQDDRWDADKIDKTLAKMHTLEEDAKGKPLLVHTDARLLIHKEKGFGKYPSFKHSRRLQPDKMTFRNELVQCAAQGCTMMMNRELLELATPIPDEARMHDMWVALVASAMGKTAYLGESTMDYRQHANNVLGGQQYSEVKTKADRAFTVMDIFVEQAKALHERFGSRMDPKKRKDLERFIEISGKGQSLGFAGKFLRGSMFANEGFVRHPHEQNVALFATSGPCDTDNPDRPR